MYHPLFIRKAVIAILLLSAVACNNSGDGSGTTDAPKAEDTTFSPSADANTSAGRELFQQRCVACHGVAGSHRGNNAEDLQVSRIDSISIVTTIKNGRKAMPMFSVFSDADLGQLEMYVKSLRK